MPVLIVEEYDYSAIPIDQNYSVLVLQLRSSEELKLGEDLAKLLESEESFISWIGSFAYNRQCDSLRVRIVNDDNTSVEGFYENEERFRKTYDNYVKVSLSPYIYRIYRISLIPKPQIKGEWTVEGDSIRKYSSIEVPSDKYFVFSLALSRKLAEDIANGSLALILDSEAGLLVIDDSLSEYLLQKSASASRSEKSRSRKSKSKKKKKKKRKTKRKRKKST